MEKVYLIILDGFGLAHDSKGNAVTQAKSPFLKKCFDESKISKLKAHGHAVGLPDFQMGGSEVGHITIGSGRPVKHVLTKINDEIQSGTFFEKENLKQLFTASQKNSRIHFLGLASDGGIHSFLPHLFGLGQMAKHFDIKDIFVHAFLDGRDVPSRTAKSYLSDIEKHKVGKIASIGGRFYGMDRDNNWDRIKDAYDILIDETAEETDNSWENILDEFYENTDKSDYYIPPKLLDKNAQIREDDIVICFNFRTDRMREIMEAFCDKDFTGFERKKVLDPQNFGVFGSYYKEAKTIFSLSSEPIKNTLGEILEHHHLTQLRVAETEKFNHVTFFFSGERKAEFEGEERIMVASPKCASYAEKPEMSAAEHTQKALGKIEQNNYSLVVHNYANGDLVGHSANLEASIKAVEVMDECLSELVPKVQKKGYTVIMTADHGNCEEMIYPNGEPCPSHSKNLVPCVILDENNNFIKIKESGTLADIAPTICELLKIKKPKEMTGESLIK